MSVKPISREVVTGETPQRNRNRSAFTLVELLVVVAILGILAALMMPALSSAKAKASSISCLNRVRQLGMSLMLYSDDFEGQYPPRRQSTNTWPYRLQPYYRDAKMLECPSDSFSWLLPMIAPEMKLVLRRSFVINGFNDWFQSELSASNYQAFLAWQWPQGMKAAAIPNPTETIVFGEKRKGSYHVHMDFSQGQAGNDVEEIDQARHASGANKEGGSNFAFADGSARFLKFGRSTTPENLWAVRDEWRRAPVRQAVGAP